MGVPCSKNSDKSNASPRHSNSSKHRPLLESKSSNEILTFNVIISNIKTRNIPMSTSALKIVFGKHKELILSEMTILSKNFIWNFNQAKFDYSTTRHDLREDSLRIYLLEKSGKEIGDVQINLHDIATGPFHHDFFIRMRKGYKEPGRINLDIKMSQNIHITVKTQAIACHLKDNLKEKFYNFCLKMNTKEQEFLSDHSLNFNNQMVAASTERAVEDNLAENYQMNIMDENKSLQTNYFITDVNKNYPKLRSEIDSSPSGGESYEEIPSPVLQSRSSSVRLSGMARSSSRIIPTPSTLARNTDITWNYQDLNDGVTLEAQGNIKELATGSFQFFLWANKELVNPYVQNPNEGNNNDEDDDEDGPVYIDHKLVGECYIGVKKLFEDVDVNFGEDTQKAGMCTGECQVKMSEFHEKLWYHGVSIGELEGRFLVQITPFYKQMVCGVRTEDGVQKSSTVFVNKDKGASFFKNSNIKEIRTLEQLKENLKTTVFNFSDTKTNPKVRIKLIDDLSTNVHKILEILRSSHKESIASFLYKTHENLLASQRILIGIARHLVEYSDEVPVTLRPVYYETLLLIMNRGELQLNFMGFDSSYAEFLKNAQKISFKNEQCSNKLELKNIQRKLEVCEKYQALLYMTLKKILDKINQKGMSEKERDFIEQFTAIAYFRVPEFRKKMLERISAATKDHTIEEWRGTEWKLGEKIDEGKKNSQFLGLFDWEGDFYVYLKNSENGEKNYQLLNEVLDDPSWQNRMQKRGIAFYFFLTEWAKHVNSTVVIREHVPWQDLPGYNTLIKALLVALKQKDVKAYPEAMIEASVAFLKNEKLLNTYISIIYNKTRVYDSQSVFQVFEVVNKWLTALRNFNKGIPTTFDYNFFFKGIYMVLDGDHALNIAKVLWVLYNNFNVFPYDQRQQLCEFVFGRVFFKFFLHWSWNVRQVFHHFLLYRLYHQHRVANTKIENLDDLKKELLLYNQRRNNEKKAKKLLINDFINMEYSRNMTIIENGYKKLKEQRAQTTSNQSKSKKPTKTKNVRYNLQIPKRTYGELASTEAGSKRKTSSINDEFDRLQLRGTQSEKKNELEGADAVSERSSSKNDTSLGQQDASYWVVNPDKLDITIQGDVPKRPTRCESMTIEASFMRGEENNFEEIDAVMEKKVNKKYVWQETKKYEDLRDLEEDNPEKKKVIHRRIIYFDKQSKQTMEIPEEYIVYLESAYTEYEHTKEQYLFWLSEVDNFLKLKKEDEVKKWKEDPKVPELLVKIPMDENVPEPDQD